LEEVVDIVKALHQRRVELQNELGKIQEAIRALGGTLSATKIARAGKRTYRHSEATKRKLRLAQKKIWDAKRKK
jgi:hypothetical protein